jgi:hypothetical protein
VAIRNTRERGTRRQARRRVGLDFPGFEGMDLESEPGSILPYRFRHLENVNFRSTLNPRGGAQLATEGSYTGCQQFISDYQPTAHRLYTTFIGLTGVSSEGRSICWFDPDFSTSVQRMLYFPWATASAILGIYGGQLFLGVDGFLKQLHLFQPISGQDPLATSGQTQDTVVASLNGYTIKALAEFDGKLFIAAENIATPTSSAIYTWDGITLRLDKAAVPCPSRMLKFRDVLVLGYAAGNPTDTNKLVTRDLAGTYADVVPSSGTVSTTDMVSHLDNLYIASGAAVLWKYDGTTLDPWHTIASAKINSVESFNGFLWFVYQSSTPHGILGRWSEVSVFNDTYKDYTDDDPLVTDATWIRAYRGKLYAVTAPTNITSEMVF